MELRETFGATHAPHVPRSGYDGPERTLRDRSSHRRAGRRPVPRARRLAAVGAPYGRGPAVRRLEAGATDSGPLAALLADPPTCVVPMLHGESGEDGAIREVLDLLGVPYVGSGPAACRTAFDKPVAKSVVARVGITTPRACACRTRRSASLAPPR